MPTHKSNDYKLTAVQYYLIEDKTQEEVCKIFKCTPRSLMRWVERYKKEGNVNIHHRTPVAYKVKKEYVKFLLDEIKKNKTITLYDLQQKLKEKYKELDITTTHIFRVIENYFSMMKSRLQKLNGLTYNNLKENINKVISEIPKEKYENIFKVLMKDLKNIFQRIKQEK